MTEIEEWIGLKDEPAVQPAGRQKPKCTQPKDNSERQGRDFFQTPHYAVDMLVPFVPATCDYVWEPACGGGLIADRLHESHLFCVYGTDKFPVDGTHPVDFLTAPLPACVDSIVTNPPYSLKKEFAERCMEHRLPWALLVPADFNLWICKAIRHPNDPDEPGWGCRIVMPTRRIDYITPTGKSGKESAAQFHSMWLTWGMNVTDHEGVPCQIRVVDLSNETKRG